LALLLLVLPELLGNPSAVPCPKSPPLTEKRLPAKLNDARQLLRQIVVLG
jgi:hypothetical protein